MEFLDGVSEGGLGSSGLVWLAVTLSFRSFSSLINNREREIEKEEPRGPDRQEGEPGEAPEQPQSKAIRSDSPGEAPEKNKTNKPKTATRHLGGQEVPMRALAGIPRRRI